MQGDQHDVKQENGDGKVKKEITFLTDSNAGQEHSSSISEHQWGDDQRSYTRSQIDGMQPNQALYAKNQPQDCVDDKKHAYDEQ